MAFLHCHNCNFNQDDFWDESYNPIRSLLHWEKDLLTQNLESKFVPTESEYSWRELLARELEKNAKNIRDMKYRTHEEFKKENPDWICPKCLKKELDID